MSDKQTPAYRNVKLNAEEHSDFTYLGDLDDAQLESYLVEIKEDIDIDKNIKLFKYYGYLHLFVIYKNKS